MEFLSKKIKEDFVLSPYTGTQFDLERVRILQLLIERFEVTYTFLLSKKSLHLVVMSLVILLSSERQRFHVWLLIHSRGFSYC